MKELKVSNEILAVMLSAALAVVGWTLVKVNDLEVHQARQDVRLDNIERALRPVVARTP